MSDPLDGFPEGLRIGPYDIEVKFPEQNTLVVDGKPAWGSYAHGALIELELGIPNRYMAVETAIHEISHAMFRTYGMVGDEEHNVSAMGMALTQVFRDNPALLKWIAARLK
jgi:hypothetical protein